MKKRVNLNIKGFLNKKENMAIVAVAVIFCAGIAVTNVKSNHIPLHDGDVLVDSQNVMQAEKESETSNFDTTSDDVIHFDEQKAALELERNDLIAGFDDTIKNSTNEAEKKNAVSQKEKITGYMEQEISIESIIKSKNLPESMVIITDSTITVTVNEQDLKQNIVAKICNIVMEETGRSADKIIIQSAY